MFIRNPAYRKPPQPGDLNRYAVSIKPNTLGALGLRRSRRSSTAVTQRLLPAAGSDTDTVALTESSAAVKEYFDVGVYRNILDMINTFQGVARRWGQAMANEASCVNANGYLTGALLPREVNVIGLQPGLVKPPGAIGYAAARVGAKGGAELKIYTDAQVKKAGLSVGAPSGFFEVPDLMNMARTINYEMNRVRLPIPHNFRQIANAIQGRDWRYCLKWKNEIGLPPKPVSRYPSAKQQWMAKVNEIISRNWINNMELLDVYAGLNNSMNVMRTSVRKEIDSANLAKKVEESTIRREQEELITRQQAAKQAEERELQILAEKKAAYEQEMADAERIKNEMAETKAQLQAELDQLSVARENAQTEAEVVAVEEKAAEVLTAQQLADQMQADMQANLQTSVAASKNLNRQIYDVQDAMATQDALAEQAGIAPKKKMNIAPILFTAAGLLLL